MSGNPMLPATGVQAARIFRSPDWTSATHAACLLQIDRLFAALHACRDHIRAQRERLRDEASFDSDRSIMLAADADQLAELDALIASIDIALAGTAP